MMRRIFLAVAVLVWLPISANAATCFWVGGTGNWDNTNTASWASASGGGAGSCAATGGIPKNAGDVATFDGASGGGTVTVCGAAAANCPTSSGTVGPIATLTTGAFTGTLDFSAINPNVTLTTSFSGAGTGTRTINLGSGTWTLSGATAVWDLSVTTNLTLSAASSNITAPAATFTGPRTLNFGTCASCQYGTISLSANDDRSVFALIGDKLGALTLNAPVGIQAPTAGFGATSITTSGGSNSAWIVINTNSYPSVVQRSVTVASGTITLDHLIVTGINFTGGATFTANTSIDLGNNAGITINAPNISTGGGFIIGGG